MCFTARDNLAGRNLQRTFSPLAAPPSPTITLVRRASDEKTPPWLWADRQWRYSIIAMKSCPYMATAGNFIGKNEKCAGRGWAIVRHGGGGKGRADSILNMTNCLCSVLLRGFRERCWCSSKGLTPREITSKWFKWQSWHSQWFLRFRDLIYKSNQTLTTSETVRSGARMANNQKKIDGVANQSNEVKVWTTQQDALSWISTLCI